MGASLEKHIGALLELRSWLCDVDSRLAVLSIDSQKTMERGAAMKLQADTARDEIEKALSQLRSIINEVDK